MLGFKKKAITHHPSVTPCLSANAILQDSQMYQYLNELKGLISCPKDIYDESYLLTAYRLAEFCQAMPFSESEFSHSYGLLERQFKLMIATLKLRRKHYFPQNANIETISSEEAQWTFALFTASLFKNLACIPANRDITLHLANGEQIGIWSALTGSLYEKDLYYTMRFKSHTLIEKEIFMATIIARIIPSITIRWLSSNQDLFTVWWDAVLHRADKNNPIEHLIMKAADVAHITLGFNNESNRIETPIPLHTVDTNEKDEPKAKIMNFITWLDDNIHTYPDKLFRMPKGFFVRNDLLDKYLAENGFISKKVFLELLANENFIYKTTNQQLDYEIAPMKFEDRRVIKGILMDMEFFPESFKKISINDVYQENIKL